jgi:hypothetical protein
VSHAARPMVDVIARALLSFVGKNERAADLFEKMNAWNQANVVLQAIEGEGFEIKRRV